MRFLFSKASAAATTASLLGCFLLSATSVLAAPFEGLGWLAETAKVTGCPLDRAPKVPTLGMPKPSKGLETVRVVLGRGVQNYMCDSDDATPKAVGADAALYDVSCMLRSKRGLKNLSRNLVPALLDVPASKIEETIDAVLPSAKIGDHFFRKDGAPKFVFDSGLVGVMSKDDSTAAPKRGEGNENGAPVDWLRLVRKDGEPDQGIEEVYRIYTAGGRAPDKCTKKGKMTVDYVAVYWMFG